MNEMAVPQQWRGFPFSLALCHSASRGRRGITCKWLLMALALVSILQGCHSPIESGATANSPFWDTLDGGESGYTLHEHSDSLWEGLAIDYTPDGRVSEFGYYKDGVRHGVWVRKGGETMDATRAIGRYYSVPRKTLPLRTEEERLAAICRRYPPGISERIYFEGEPDTSGWYTANAEYLNPYECYCKMGWWLYYDDDGKLLYAQYHDTLTIYQTCPRLNE